VEYRLKIHKMVLRKLIVFSWVVTDVLGQRRMSNREYESKLPDVPTPKSDIISMNADFTTNVAPPTNVVHPHDPATQKDVTADIAVATPDKVATAQGNSRGNKESSEEGNATEAKAAAYSAVTSGASMSDAMKESTTDTSKNDPIVGNVVTQTVAPIRFDSIVQFYVDKVTPLAISMDEFAYTQVGFCDVQKTNHYGNVNFRGTERLLESGGKHFHFIMGLNMTRAPVCSQQLSKDQTKALELLIDYQYYARYFIGERQTEARNATQPKATEKNPTITGEVSPLELEHFLGVRLDDMSDFLTFMKRHQSSTDVPADFKFGKRKFTEASYWVFTHKVFIIYYDPKTSKILDAVLEVNELQLVSPTTVMQIHHTVYWLPRDEAEFRSKSDNWGLGSWDQQKAGSGIAGNSDKIDVRNHRHVGPQGLDVDFEVHPTIVVLPLLLSIIVFILVKPNVALEATSAIVETYDPESGTYHITTTPTARDTNSATGLFGDNAAPATGLLAALRKLQLFVKSIGRQDMFKNDPVLSAGGIIGDCNVIFCNICKVMLIFGGEFFILAVVFLTIYFLPIAMWSIQDLFFLSLIPSGLFGGMLWGSFTKADKIEGPVNAYAASECCEIHEIPDDTSTPCVPEKLLESSVMAFLLLKSGLNLLMFASVLSIWGSMALLCLNAFGLSIGIVFSKHLLPDWVDLGMRVNTGCLLNRILSPQELNANDIEYQEMNELKGFRGEVVNCSDEVRGERISIENDATQQKDTMKNQENDISGCSESLSDCTDSSNYGCAT